jgi:hypothetical protein
MYMIFHVLNGDALVDRFVATGLQGEMVVMRECLIEGDLSGDTLDALYLTRANYLTKAYSEVQKSYFDEVVSEFNKLSAAPDESEFNLWFGYDLFCNANMWFVLSLLQGLSISKRIYVVYPSYLTGNDVWQDFGGASPDDLLKSYNKRIPFAKSDLQLAAALWEAYKHTDLVPLALLSKQPSICFPYLEEVCRAHIERFTDYGGKGRPEKIVEELIAGGETGFPIVFSSFFKRAGVYGFGDLQVRRIYDKVMQSK